MRQPSKENPDRGPSMRHEALEFDKGYETDLSNESPHYPEDNMRGNRYSEMQNEIKRSDRAKIVKSKAQKY